MAEYIKREIAKNMFQRFAYDDWNQGANVTWAEAFGEAAELIDAIPAADVRPVVHGRWHYTDAFPHWVCCSVCFKKFIPNREWIEFYDVPTNFCPNCGAKMDAPSRPEPSEEERA